MYVCDNIYFGAKKIICSQDVNLVLYPFTFCAWTLNKHTHVYHRLDPELCGTLSKYWQWYNLPLLQLAPVSPTILFQSQSVTHDKDRMQECIQLAEVIHTHLLCILKIWHKVTVTDTGQSFKMSFYVTMITTIGAVIRNSYNLPVILHESCTF